MFFGAMLGFAICMRFVVDRFARNDGTVSGHTRCRAKSPTLSDFSQRQQLNLDSPL
jgi:hypothetical protein